MKLTAAIVAIIATIHAGPAVSQPPPDRVLRNYSAVILASTTWESHTYCKPAMFASLELAAELDLLDLFTLGADEDQLLRVRVMLTDAIQQIADLCEQ